MLLAFLIHLHRIVAVLDEGLQHAADPAAFPAAEPQADLPRQVLLGEDAAADGVFDIVVHIGDFIGIADHPALLRPAPCLAVAVRQDALSHLLGEIEAAAVPFQTGHHPDALGGVVEVGVVDVLKGVFPGVAEGGMPQIVPQGDGLGEVLVEAQRPAQGAGDLANLQRVGQPGAVVVALRGKKDLRFVGQPPEGVTVQDAVPVPLEGGTHGAFLLGELPAAGAVGKGGAGGKDLVLQDLLLLSNGHGVFSLGSKVGVGFGGCGVWWGCKRPAGQTARRTVSAAAGRRPRRSRGARRAVCRRFAGGCGEDIGGADALY